MARKGDPQMDYSCANRIALTFDDGTSSFRPKLLQVLRDKQVHAAFFDSGVRVLANPQIARFQVAEGHVELNHTVLHVHMDQITRSANQDEVLRNAAILAAAGAPLTFRGIRPPFGGANPDVQRLLTEMGYTSFLNRIDAQDWLPDKSAAAIRDDIITQLAPGVIIGLHDGPVDTSAGAATVEAVGQIIDRARELGYRFGVVDRSGHVVADRYVSSGLPIPQVTNPVPYRLPLTLGTVDRIPEPWVRIPSPIGISAAHRPATFVRGQTGATLTLTVTNHSSRSTDGSPVLVTDEIPAGLTVTSAAGPGWTCVLEGPLTCTRTDVLAPHRSYPPIVVRVDVAADAPATIVHQPTLLGHGEAWSAETSETITVRAP
jgi:peptidoglycan/xylan/chitin deacetylase (PgdA/CDA1 family)